VSAAHRLGGFVSNSTKAAPYMPSPKNAECPNYTMPV